MKTISSPRIMKKDGDYKDSISEPYFAKILIKLILLITISLLIVEITQAQRIMSFAGNHTNAIGLNNKITFQAAGNKNLVSAIVLRKADSVSSAPVTKVRHLDHLVDSEDKANQMVDSYFQGVYDADSNYKAKKTGKGLIFITTLITGPVGGIIPTIACSAGEPNHDLNIPNSPLVTDESYMKGYKSEAHYIKRHNTWPRYVIASIIWIAAANLILR